MDTSELFRKALVRATGKTVNITASDSRWSALLDSANILIDAWADEPSVNWESLYDPSYELATVSATNEFDLDDEINKLSDKEGDYVQIIKDGHTYNYTIIPANELKLHQSSRVCSRVGTTLRFPKKFTSESPELGGKIYAPVYLKPKYLEDETSIVPVDDPNWLVLMLAAEYARGKVTLRDQYQLILAQAVESMNGMRDANESQAETLYRLPVVRTR